MTMTSDIDDDEEEHDDCDEEEVKETGNQVK